MRDTRPLSLDALIIVFSTAPTPSLGLEAAAICLSRDSGTKA